MTLVRITLNLAFHDSIGASADILRDSLIDHAVDNFEAEIAFAKTNQWTCPVIDPDFDADDTDTQIEQWQERATAELS